MMTIDSEAEKLQNELFNDIVPKYHQFTDIRSQITEEKADKYWQYVINTYFEGVFTKGMPRGMNIHKATHR